MSNPATPSYPYREPSNLYRWALYAVYFHMAMAALSVYSDYLEISFLQDLLHGGLNGDTEALAKANDSRQVLVVLLFLFSFFFSGFLVLRWTHRANWNTRAIGAGPLRYTPGWAIGWYFVPFLSLWRPYEAMREIWAAIESRLAPQHSHAMPPLGIWWTLWIITLIANQVAFRIGQRAQETEQLIHADYVNLASNVIEIVLSFALLKVMTRIQQAQNDIARQQGLLSPYAD